MAESQNSNKTSGFPYQRSEYIILIFVFNFIDLTILKFIIFIDQCGNKLK